MLTTRTKLVLAVTEHHKVLHIKLAQQTILKCVASCPCDRVDMVTTSVNIKYGPGSFPHSFDLRQLWVNGGDVYILATRAKLVSLTIR